jgi:glycosyltransferase involved in cell wall biosynthesis
MRYLFVTSYPPTRCGIGIYASQSVEQLRSDGHVVDVISPNMDGSVDLKYDLCGGLKILKLLNICLFYDRIVIQYHPVFFFKKSGDCGEWLDNLLANLSFVFFFLCYRKKIELICHEIHYYPMHRIGVFNYFTYRAWWILAKNIVFHTDKERDTFKRNIRSGMRWRKLEVRPHHQDFSKYRDISEAEARRELGISMQDRVFLCIGFIQSHKGFDRVIKAFNAVDPANARLYIVGSLRWVSDATVNYLKLLRFLAAENPRVKIIDRFVSDAEFDTWIAACDYIVAPYRQIWSSSVVARAKLFAKKVIAADVGGLDEQLDGEGFLFTTDAELESFIRQATGSHGSAGTQLGDHRCPAPEPPLDVSAPCGPPGLLV